jgi:hypothetical protein
VHDKRPDRPNLKVDRDLILNAGTLDFDRDGLAVGHFGQVNL